MEIKSVNKFLKFIEEYEKLKVLNKNVYLCINELPNKNLWRISIFGKDLAIIGDAEFMTVEAEDRDKAFELAIAKIQAIPGQIFDAIKLKESGRKIHVKRD